MKLTKKQETEVWQVYNKWLDAYLNGDIKTYNKYLDKDYHFIGSTNNEEFLSKKDTTQFFKDTADQLAGKCDLRNEIKIIEKFEGLVFVTHLFDAWFKNVDDYAYYGRFRFTNALKENKEGWRFIYQHFSTTDSKTDEGETIGFDKVNKENQELREAIQRRTIELELKNRELKVETALERIRAQAVAMKQSTDLLDIVVTMRNEFIKLGHEAHYFWHMMWLPETYEKAMTSGDGSKIGFVMQLPRHIHGDIPQLAKWEKSKKPTVVYAMNVDEAIDYVDKMVALGDFKNIDPQAPTHDDIRHIGGLTFIMARTTHGEIGYSLPGIVDNPPKEDVDILVKFAGAFDLAHQRYLDLQKAEKQTRETLIELSLERIRSRVTAMQESSDLFDIVVTMRNEFLSLGHEADYFWHMKWAKDNYEMSMTAEDGGRLGMIITVPKFVHDEIPTLAAWEKSKSPYFVLALNGKDAWDYIEKMNTYGKYKLVDPHAPSEEDILHIGGLTFIIARTTHGEIGFSLAGKIEEPPKASIEILVRFASVFDLAYKRFEDLKKAEAQAKETQIELALEKVRSRTMAMQHSDELQEASFLLDQQVRELGIKTWGCAFNIYGEKESTEWFGNEAGVLHTYTVPREGVFKDYYDKGQKGESLFIQEFSGDDCVAHYEYMSSLPVIGDVLKQLKKTNKGFPTYQIDHVVYFKYGYLLFITRESVPEAHHIFKRFAKVFEQTYTRFLDLQKAEAQAKEAKIEAALERVRSTSMAMHKTEDLSEVVTVYFKQLKLLNIEFVQSWITIFHLEKNYVDVWFSPLEGIHNTCKHFKMPSTLFEDTSIKSWKEGNSFSSISFETKEQVNQFFQVCDDVTSSTYFGDMQKKFQLERFEMLDANHKYGCISKSNIVEATIEEKEILHRFAKVFEQTYTRFLDLQKAEAQARESQIEAALERVRSQSIGMQSSDDLSSVTTEMFNQLRNFGGDLFATGIVFCDKHKGHVEQWHSLPNAGMMSPFIVPIDLDYIHQYRYDQWKKGAELFSIEIPSDFIEQHFQDIFNLPSAQKVLKDFEEQNTPMPKAPPWEIDYGASFKQGYILVSSLEHFKEAEILPRFAKVFEQAYIRFMDLQKAEAQAREAQIETALERVRSRTLAMQNSEELAQTSVVVFQQLLELGIAPNRLFIGIIKDNGELLEAWATNEDGSKIETQFTLHNSKNKSIKKMIDGWKQHKKSLVIDMKGKELQDYFQYLNKDMDIPFIHGLNQKRRVQTIAYFSGGLIGMAAPEEQPQDTINLLERFAAVFNLTYTRFNDLKIAEAQTKKAEEDLIKLQAAKKNAEDALSELQLTQNQLIQSEKMASLGELTAGIAHEIQNPLNFVNNFSEVSKELLDEMLEEIESGDMEEVKAIMDDVIQNLEKINHHGKRADGIVKGMLQHSRASGNQKEPTNINALADEYLRLAYHGLRAKDKSFNATLVTDFDDNLENINVIPQDIGRVVLNLLTNAFYAVSEKKNQNNIEDFEPTVSIATKKDSNKVIISVKDNGNGIPQKVVDKIFQPFFTTKPTGQGTGLGLSMSYDIVTKGHGGELQVKTEEGKGTEFRIILPITS